MILLSTFNNWSGFPKYSWTH